jgi:hypothetical protein
MFSPVNNSITVGKVMVTLPANQYVFTALPFMEDRVPLSAVISDQIGNSGEFLWWDGNAFHGATYSNAEGRSGAAGWRETGDAKQLQLGEGFILRAPTAVTIALVGRFGTLAPPAVKNLTAQPTYNLIAFAYPRRTTLEEMGLTSGAEGIIQPTDDILGWNVESQVYGGATFATDGGWGTSDLNALSLASPRFLRLASAGTGTTRAWTLRFP